MSYKNVSYVGIALLVVGALLVASAEAVLVPPSGNIIWLDAEDPNGDGSAGPADGTPLAFWADKSGIATPNDYTSYGEDPLYQNGVLNGNAVLRHDGSNWMISPWTMIFGDFTNFVVVKADPGSQLLWEEQVEGQPSTNWSHLSMSNEGASGMTSVQTGRGGTFSAAVIATGDATPDWGNTGVFQVVETSFGGTVASQMLYQDGTEVPLIRLGGDPTSFQFGSQLKLGDRAWGGIGLIGDLAEFLMFDRVLTEGETETVGLYLSDRYGISTAYGPSDPADLNMDGFVDGLDLGIQLGNWNQTVAPELGELNGLPPVDGLDLGILLGAWNPPPLSGSAAVPEPTGVALLLCGLLSLKLRRGRRK